MNDNTPPKLIRIKADAIVMIGEQINIGKNLLKRQPSDKQEFDTLKNDTKTWTDYNKRRFTTLFDKSPLPDWHGEPVYYIELQSFGREIAEHKKNISRWINDLESIYKQLEIYEELPSNTQQTMNKKKKKYFIGHGGSLVWRELKDFLENTLKLPYEEFNRIPQAGKTTSNRLKEMLESCYMAFLIMTGEDEHTDGTLHARENVIHEIGLFQAQLGYERAIILLEDDCKDFSNIRGITYIPFPKGNIRAAFEDIREVLKRESILEQERSQDINHAANTDTDDRLREYWSEFKEYCDNHGMSLEPVTWNRHTQYFGFRLSLKNVSEQNIWLATWRDEKNHRIAVNLHFRLGESGSEGVFNMLMEDKETIEEVFGGSLKWQRESDFGTPGPLVGVYENITPDRDDWEEQFEWMFTTLEDLNRTFRPFIFGSFNHLQLRDL